MKLACVGDSLTAIGSGVPTRGLVYGIRAYFNRPGLTVEDHGHSGMDTTEYLAQWWLSVILSAPDWMLIMFGVNDQGSGIPAETTYRDNLAIMFDDARQIGAEPILLTSPPKIRPAPPGVSGGIERPNLLAPYVAAAKAQAAADGVAVIDLDAAIGAKYDRYGYQVSRVRWSYENGGVQDNNHWNNDGAFMAAAEVWQQMPAANPSLAAYRVHAPHVREANWSRGLARAADDARVADEGPPL